VALIEELVDGPQRRCVGAGITELDEEPDEEVLEEELLLEELELDDELLLDEDDPPLEEDDEDELLEPGGGACPPLATATTAMTPALRTPMPTSFSPLEMRAGRTDCRVALTPSGWDITRVLGGRTSPCRGVRCAGAFGVRGGRTRTAIARDLTAA